ncbi:MAG TPA: ABC transporter substrate-binding protein [Candidatus Dormibacteraeota bacterium]
MPGWWGGSPGVLQHVHIDVAPDEAAAVQGFESGRFDMLGSWYDMRQFPNIEPPFEAASSRWKPLITTCCGVEFVAFNLAEGPFAGPGGKPGRIAFSQAIDRVAVVRAIDHVPQHAYLTDPATGGPITKGMRGYLGDGRDPYAKVNPTAARALYAQWDPDGSKVKGLAFTYNPTPINDAEARALQAQWKANLGVDVQLQPVDPQTFFDGQSKNLYTMFRQGFARTYNDPEEALDILFRPSFGGIPAGASSPQLDALLTTARQDRPEHALADYLRAAQMVVDDALVATLFYPQHFLVTQPYVEGGRVKPFGDGWQWTDLRILKH